MENRILLFFGALMTTLISVSSVNQCGIINEVSSCIYTVVCDTYGGSAQNPNCNDEPYVTFVMNGSTAENLDAAFFGATNFDSRVREITALNNKWTNLVEGCFKYYSKTVIIDLSNNNIKSISGPAFENSLMLQNLNLSNNYISDLNYRSFSPSATKPAKIKELDLSYNEISNLPSSLFNQLNNLEILHLDNNLIGILPEEIFKYSINIQELYLHNNILIDLNESLIHLKYLKYLDLSHNNLTEISGVDMNRLTSLEQVNLSDNAIETLAANCFNQAFDLKVVNLRNNKLKSVIENIMFLNNVKLTYLDLENNIITKIQDDAFKHNTLEYLNLQNNNITGEIVKNTFTGLGRIKNFTVSNQSITIIRYGAFSDMTALNVLNISHNMISIIENSSFGVLSNLILLDVSFNRISDLDFLYNSVRNLTELKLNNNLLTILRSDVFIYQNQLKTLDMSMNRIKVVEQNSLPLKNLQYLNIAGNTLNGLIKPNTFSPAQYLRYLDLSKLNISKIADMAFVNLPVLAWMNLSNNAIEYIESNNFIDTNNIYSLDLSHNKLNKVILNDTLGNLQALYINNNIMESLPKLNVSSVIYLDISFNNLYKVSGDIFKNMPNLRALHVSQNKLKSFNNDYTNNLSALTDLILSGNEISEINLSYFKELINLDVSHNKILALDKSFLQGIDLLQSFDISNNNITQLVPGTFQNIKNLKFLNMSSNSLTDLRYGSLKGLHRAEVIDISKNDIGKIDVEIFHECLELKKLILDFNVIKSFDIERLLIVSPKLSSISIGGNPLSCKEIVKNIGKINLTLTFRAVEITSIDKIYHEDNVYGIKCGDNHNTADYVKNAKAEGNTLSEHSVLSFTITILLLILLLILTLILNIFLVTKAYFYYKKVTCSSHLKSESRLRRSVDLSGSDFQNDLISYN